MNFMKRMCDKELIKNLRENDLWENHLKDDCKSSEVLPIIRDNKIDFYYKGGKLFEYSKNIKNGNKYEFKTHIKYAAVIECQGKDYLTESELLDYKLSTDFSKNYERIKENCSKYSGVEAIGVSILYKKYSYLSDSNIVVLDIEVSFESKNEGRRHDRIDLLLFDKISGTLNFIEAKHYTNSELWSTKKPDVVEQIERYENQIADRKDKILSDYKEYIELLNKCFETELHSSLPYPKEIEEKTTLLIFGFDNDQKNGRLKKNILENEKYSRIKIYSIGNTENIKNPVDLWNKAKIIK